MNSCSPSVTLKPIQPQSPCKYHQSELLVHKSCTKTQTICKTLNNRTFRLDKKYSSKFRSASWNNNSAKSSLQNGISAFRAELQLGTEFPIVFRSPDRKSPAELLWTVTALRKFRRTGEHSGRLRSLSFEGRNSWPLNLPQRSLQTRFPRYR